MADIEIKNSKLIVAQGKKIIQLESLSELESKIFGKDYKYLNQNEKLQQRYNMALPQSIMNNIPIVYTTKGIINKDKIFDSESPYLLEKSIVIDDEITFILSLCKVNNLRILEKEGANIFLTDEEDKNNICKDSNYIFINSKVDEIMKKHLQLKRMS